MKQSGLFIIVCFLFATNALFSQETNKDNLSVMLTSGIGYGKAENENQTDYDLNSNDAEALITWLFNEHYGVTTGVGLNRLSGNAFNVQGNFYHQRDEVKIPLLLTIDEELGQVTFIGHVGPYIAFITNDEYQHTGYTAENYFDGSSVGLEIRTALAYQLEENVSFGIAFNGQSAITKQETTNSAPLQDEQRIINLDQLGLILAFDF